MHNHVLAYVRLLIVTLLFIGTVLLIVAVAQKYRVTQNTSLSIDYHFAAIQDLDVLEKEVRLVHGIQVEELLPKINSRETLINEAKYLIRENLDDLISLQEKYGTEPFSSMVGKLNNEFLLYTELSLFDANTTYDKPAADTRLSSLLLQIQQLKKLHRIENTKLIQQRQHNADADLKILVLLMLLAVFLGGFFIWKIVAVIKQILRQQQITSEELFHEKERSLTTLTSIGDAVITTNTQGSIDFMNPVAESLTGWSFNEASGKSLTEVLRVVNEETGQPATDLVKRVLHDGVTVGLANHTVLIDRNGNKRPIEDSAAPIRNREGDINGIVVVFHDVTQARKMAQAMTWQATHDALTGLTNRHKFEDHLQELIDSHASDGHQHAFLYLDLDQFKIVNDTSGHIAGDELLKQISEVLKGQVRDIDTVARLGGDEFGILLASCPLEQAKRIADQVRQSVQEFHFVWDNKSFVIGCSIGLVPITHKMNKMGDIMRAADVACYAAKDVGRNRVHVYESEDANLKQREGEMHLATQINEALNDNRLVLYYQTIEPLLNTGEQGEHFEILVRMLDKNASELLPMSFIPAAERYNLMPQVDRWVISQALQILSSWKNRNVDFFSINISGQSLGDETFLDFVTEQLEKHPFNPMTICFEITETAAITNFPLALSFFNSLKEKGCLFALDDFGSGLSSFGYLKNMPVDFLKIDGSFVRDMLLDPIDHAMVESINSIGHTMHIRTIAEFVESHEIADALRKMGVDYGQGYGLSRPQPLITS